MGVRPCLFFQGDYQPDLKGRLWPRKGACTALTWVCRIGTSSSGDLRSKYPLYRLLPFSHLRFCKSARLPLGLLETFSHLRSRPSRDERGPRYLPRVFHGDDGSGLQQRCISRLVPRNSTGKQTGRTVCPRRPILPGSGPGIVLGMHPENYHRDKRNSSLK